MNFTVDWLQQYVDTDGLTSEAIADKLTMLGLEVDAVTPLFEELKGVKVAKILKAEPHPDADKLQVCQVAVGDQELEIVCGAPNAREGLVTAVATVGTVLPGDFKIKKSKVRGVSSNGMLCSEKELGLSEESDGIIELDSSLQHGLSLPEAIGLKDTMIEVDLTPNRADCASVIGIAREVGGFTGNELKLPVEGAKITRESNAFSVTIEAPELCQRYAAQLVENVTVASSPLWLRKRLLSVGLRPINNVVDITNFVMMEYGQPLHAFDFDTLGGKKIIVRTPAEQETTFTTLDEKERKIDPGMLLICDGNGPVAVAGVMGGMNSEVTPNTTNVLIESACFNAVSIRRTARQLNLSTDASYRFERGVDPEITINAMQRAVQLLCELAGGTTRDGEGRDVYPSPWQETVIPLSVSRCNDLNGINLTAQQMAELLESIKLPSQIINDDRIDVTAPSFRMDIEREADLIEEISRLYGYDNIPVTLPQVDLSYPEQESSRKLRLRASDILTQIGFSEAINYSFTSIRHLDMMSLAADDPRRNQVQLLNPLTEDQAVMRTMLLPGLLENIRRNINFQSTSVRLFEIGKVFLPRGSSEQPLENMRLAGVLSGDLNGWNNPLYYKHQDVDIFDAKGCIEHILAELRLELNTGNDVDLRFEIPAEPEPFIAAGYALALTFEKNVVGYLGKLDTSVVKSFGIKQDVYFFELDFDLLATRAASPKSFVSLPVYPSVTRDIALVVPESVSSGELLSSVRESREKLIEHSDIFDIYTGDKIPEGYKSVALTITYRSPSKTLTEKNVEKAHGKIVSMLTEKFGGQFREA